MKGVKLKCGLLSVLFIMLGLSLGVSSDTNALKYSYNAYPLYNAQVYNSDASDYYSTPNPAFAIYFDKTNVTDFTLNSLLEDSNFYRRHSYCTDYSSPSFTYQPFNTSSYFMVATGSVNDFWRSFNDYTDCSHNVVTYTTDSIYASKYDVSTGEPLQFVNINQALFDPSSEYYSGGSISRVDIPLHISQDNVGTISAGTPIQWEFGLVGADTGFSYFDTNVNVGLELNFIDSSNSVVTDNTATCSVDSTFGTGIPNGYLQILPYMGYKVTCNYTPTTDMSYISASLIMYGGSFYSPSTFLTYDYRGVYFYGGYLITNNDSTWSGLSANPVPTGTNVEQSVGYSQLYGTPSSGCAEGDFLCQLGNLFSFNFINPFAPIFNLFSNNESCAQIPNLADMIHSDETQVCPWFDSSVRNIVTPVFGLSSMMLVFGFAVRWLGSRSGNFIEDSGGIDSGGYHFENKYRRGK